jgi:hypothetical protein
VGRSVVLAIIAGLALAAMWQGTTALVAAVGVTFYIAAIEAIEPLSQELDHPGMLELVPIDPGEVLLTHTISAVVAMTAIYTVAGIMATLVTLDWDLAVAVAIAAVPGAAAAVAGAALSIKRFDSPMLVPSPEVEGPRLLIRLLWPPALATAGAATVLVARSAAESNGALAPTVNTAAGVSFVAILALVWIRFRDGFMETVAESQGKQS